MKFRNVKAMEQWTVALVAVLETNKLLLLFGKLDFFDILKQFSCVSCVFCDFLVFLVVFL